MSDRSAKIAASANPSPLVRRLTSVVMRRMVSPARRRRKERRLDRTRRLLGRPHRVELFHQVDDPYSHLAVQAVRPLLERYEIEVVTHLVGQTVGANIPEPSLLADYSRKDCGWIAPHFGLRFPTSAEPPSPEALQLGQRILARHLDDPDFADIAVAVGDALWTGDKDAFALLAGRYPPLDPEGADAVLEQGNRRREKRGHYSGGMFLYGAEWFWGVDRLEHLERKLTRLGAAKGEDGVRFARPPLDAGAVPNEDRLKLEIYPSLRSPYTAVIFDKSLEVAAQVGIEPELRPVLPMVMRGVPATFAKGQYIFTDANREAEALGVPFGNILDPIGHPVERGFALWPIAHAEGKGAAFLSSFLKGAFAERIDVGSDAGLRIVAERAGLDFDACLQLLGQEHWRDELEENRVRLYEELGLWGVPSYRLSGPDGEPDLEVWGQDRLWLVAAEIRRRLGA